MGDAKCACFCRRMTRAGASNRWWHLGYGCGHSARPRRCGSTRSAGTGRRCPRGSPGIGADDVNSLTTSAFELPDRLAAKADPALIADDEKHFAAIAQSLEQSIADLSDRLDAERKAPGGMG